MNRKQSEENLPDGWEVKQLKSIAKIKLGGTPDTSKDNYWNGDIYWCTPTDITELNGKKYIYQTAKKITNEGLNNSSANIVEPNSILLCTRATLGESAINKLPMTTNQGFKNITLNKNTNVEFIFYYINTLKQLFKRLGVGTTFLEVSKKDIEKLYLPLPPLSEQKKIADILTTWDNAIDKTESLINAKTNLKRGLMQKLLTGKVRFKEFEGQKWEKVKIKDISKCYSGGTPSRQKEEYYINGTINWIKSGEVNERKIYFTEEKITTERLNNSSAKMIKPNTILVAMYGAIAGKVAVSLIEASINQAILAILPNNNVNYLFLFYLLEYSMIRVTKIVQGGQPNLNSNIITNTKIQLPSLEEQQKIASVLSSIDIEIDLLNNKLNKLKQQKKGLMQKLLTGKVRVKV